MVGCVKRGASPAAGAAATGVAAAVAWLEGVAVTCCAVGANAATVLDGIAVACCAAVAGAAVGTAGAGAGADPLQADPMTVIASIVSIIM